MKSNLLRRITGLLLCARQREWPYPSQGFGNVTRADKDLQFPFFWLVNKAKNVICLCQGILIAVSEDQTVRR